MEWYFTFANLFLLSVTSFVNFPYYNFLFFWSWWYNIEIGRIIIIIIILASIILKIG